jgi:hypothetical protein
LMRKTAISVASGAICAGDGGVAYPKKGDRILR